MCALLFLLACGGISAPPLGTPPSAPVLTVVPVHEPPSDPARLPLEDPGPETLAPGAPATLYAACEARVEEPEARGECVQDADCVRQGCGGERCVAASAEPMLSTCEDRPCFHVLDRCGCAESRCRWTLKDALPQGKLRLPGGTP